MQQNQVYVIQVNTNNSKFPLALPSTAGTILPSEVKYSASLVRGLGGAHLVLGTVLFLLGVLGSWVEPETCWSGAGVWGGIATLICGTSGVMAYHLWYKNYTIKAFLVSSVVCFVISILAIILIIYALVNRHEQFYNLLQEAESKPWFKPYNTDQEHQLTVSVSANLLVGFVLEFILSVWSVKIGWKGVRAEEFSSNKRDSLPDDLQSIASTTQHHGQQVPLAAIYQLLQNHPELLGSKTAGGGLGSPWMSSLDDRPSHRSMDYQERVSRFLSHAIEDQNPSSFSRSPSTIQEDIQEIPSPNEGRGSPSSSADTAVVLPESSQSNPIKLNPTATAEKPNKVEDQHIAKIHTTKVRSGEPKSRAPNPKVIKDIQEKDYRDDKTSQESETVVQDDKVTHGNTMLEKSEEKEQKQKKKSKDNTSSSAAESNPTEDKEKSSGDNRDTHQRFQTEKQKNTKENEHSTTISEKAVADHNDPHERSEKQKSKKVKEHGEGHSKHSGINIKEENRVSTNNTDQSEQEKQSRSEREQNHVNRNYIDPNNKSEKTEKEKSKREKDKEKASKYIADVSKQPEITEKEKSTRENDHATNNDIHQSKPFEETEKQKKKEKEQEPKNTVNVDESKQLEKSEKKKRKKEREQNEVSIPSTNAHKSEDTDKSEKHKSKKEKQRHEKENELENNQEDNERREKKKHKKNEKHRKLKGQTSVTNESRNTPLDIPEAVNTNIKNNVKKSESTGQNKEMPDHIIALKPPSEFQDIDLKAKC